MSFFKVIVYFLLFFTVVVDSRSRRKRSEDARSSAYYGNSRLGSNPNIAYALGLMGYGNNWYPLGNNWYMPGPQSSPYNNQFGYNMQSYPSVSSYSYPSWLNNYGTGQYGPSGSGSQYAYMDQSYIPPSNEWLPLPGYNRRRSRRDVIALHTDKVLSLSKDK